MILNGNATTPVNDNRTTLDDLFRRAAVRRPDAPALIDPPNRKSFTGGTTRQLTYAQADSVVWAIAARLRQLGLQTDAIVAMQLPNTVETVLAILGVLRAGMIAVPLPMLWRHAEITSALSGTRVKMLITCARIGQNNPVDHAMHAAAELFSVRHVGAFGSAVNDGFLALDDVFATAAPEITSMIPRTGNPALHTAVVTFDMTPAGPVAVARNHQHLIAGGLAVFLEGGIGNQTTILSAVPMASFGGLVSSMMPWLLAGGTLVLHQPFDAETFSAQRDVLAGATLVVPGALAARLSRNQNGNMNSVVALWRTPERCSSAIDRFEDLRHLDVTAFGETGLVVSRPTPNGAIAPIALGIISAPYGSAAALQVIETTRTVGGTLAVRGAMVPSAGFPPVTERDNISDDGFVDTLYPCRFDPDGATLTITGPQPGMVGVGGYRFSQSRLNALVAAISDRATIVALPDGLTGQRLAGSAPNVVAMRAQLQDSGHNPLIVDAFRPRGALAAS